MSADSFQTPVELGERLHLSGRSVRRLAAAGVIPFYRLSGKALRFKWTEVEQALARLRIPAKGEAN